MRFGACDQESEKLETLVPSVTLCGTSTVTVHTAAAPAVLAAAGTHGGSQNLAGLPKYTQWVPP